MKLVTNEIYLKEATKLAEGLMKLQVPFEFRYHMNGVQICVPNHKDCRWDVICHDDSIGRYDGLLEAAGDIVDIRSKKYADGVEGYLTADEVLARLK